MIAPVPVHLLCKNLVWKCKTENTQKVQKSVVIVAVQNCTKFFWWRSELRVQTHHLELETLPLKGCSFPTFRAKRRKTAFHRHESLLQQQRDLKVGGALRLLSFEKKQTRLPHPETLVRLSSLQIRQRKSTKQPITTQESCAIHEGQALT